MKIFPFTRLCLSACLLVWSSSLPAQAAETYVDLSSLYNQKAFVTTTPGPGAALDRAGRWLDATTLPASYS